MAKDLTTSRIWRTVVFAGAMLGTPSVALAQESMPNPNAPVSKAPVPMPIGKAPMPIKADPAMEKQAKINSLTTERSALLAKLVETEPKELDKLRRDIVAKDAAIRKLVDDLVALRKPRPRTPLVQKPVGRGFVLA
jgi:hypothetical protein